MDTRKQFKAAMLQRGYDEAFIEDYRSELYRQKILDKYRAADPTVWDDVQNLYDEYNYFGAGFDEVVLTTNEAWMPDPEKV